MEINKEILDKVVLVLQMALYISAIATTATSGIKNALGVDDSFAEKLSKLLHFDISKSAINRIIAFIVVLMFTIWFHFCVYELPFTFSLFIEFITAYAGDEAIYLMMGSLTGATKKNAEFNSDMASVMQYQPTSIDEDGKG